MRSGLDGYLSHYLLALEAVPGCKTISLSVEWGVRSFPFEIYMYICMYICAGVELMCTRYSSCKTH